MDCLPRPSDIITKELITNGEPYESTLEGYAVNGFIVVASLPAKDFHPYATDSDILTIFAKPINKEAYDDAMREFNLKGNNRSEQSSSSI